MKEPKKGPKGKGVSWRPKKGYGERLEDLCEATERPKTYFLDKAIEAKIPEWEQQYATELAELRKRRADYPPLKESDHYQYNDRAAQTPAPSTKPEDVAAAALGQRAVNELPGSPVKPPPPAPPAETEADRNRRKVVGIVRRAAAAKTARQGKHVK